MQERVTVASSKPSTIQPRFLRKWHWFSEKFTVCSWRFSLVSKFNTGFLYRMRTGQGSTRIKCLPYTCTGFQKTAWFLWKNMHRDNNAPYWIKQRWWPVLYADNMIRLWIEILGLPISEFPITISRMEKFYGALKFLRNANRLLMSENAIILA